MLRAFGVFLVGGVLASGVLAQSGRSDGFALFADRHPTEAEAAKNYTAAKHEPRVGCYVGAFLDLDSSLKETFRDSTGKVRRLPLPFEQIVGKQHATYFYYMGYGSRLATDWITQLGNEGRIVHVALEPNNGLDKVKDDEYLTNMAKGMGETRVPIFLRFASEMNGPWVKYHGNPKLYIEKFRLVADKMRQYAPNVAMVWCPYATPTRLIPSYYPGDAYVDWVGVNIYSVTYYDQDWKKPAKQVHPTEKLDYVYDRYSAKKPIMIGEYGAAHWSALESKSTTDFAMRAIQAMYQALPRAYPRVKCINYFNTNNMELEHRKNNNYAVTQNPQVLDLYRSIIRQNYFLSQAVDRRGFAVDQVAAQPVSGANLTFQDLVPVTPLPVRQKQAMSGTTRLSGWIRDHSGATSMRFILNGRTIHLGKTKQTWEFNWDTTSVANGVHKLELWAERNGRAVAKYPITVTVQN